MNAYTRWAQLVVNTVCCPSDPRTLTSWSDYFGISEGTLRARCRAAGVAAIAARDFSRLLRVVVRSQRNDPRWDPAAYLEAGDPRTIRRLLVGGGLADWPDGAAAPSVDCFLDRQRFVDGRAVAAVRAAMAVDTEGTRVVMDLLRRDDAPDEKPVI